jgi:cobyrinic acid a,c-diamide synthase
VSGGPRQLPRLLIGGVSSGVGKTTFTVGLCRALMRRGLKVQLFKCGPDYLDPTYHRKASRNAVHNLDSWLMGPEAVRSTFARNAALADISLIEGVMGLFDGASPTDLSGSSAQIAQLLDCPIALLCDATGMARSLSAVVKGFCSFEPGIAPRAVIANRVGSTGHLSLLQEAQLPEAPVLGGLLKREALGFSERHLGLVAAQEGDHEAAFEAWADEVEAHCNIDALLELARSAPAFAFDAAPHASLQARRLDASHATHGSRGARDLHAAHDSYDSHAARDLRGAASENAAPGSGRARCRIGIALDAAFHFYYDENLRLLEAYGAELVHFSPIADTTLPELDGVYIGGGYPELHAEQLAANSSMLEAMRAHARAGKPVYAECGGLMYLAQAIVDLKGRSFPMLALLAGTAIMQPKLQALGYVDVTTRESSPLGAAGIRYRGHQFRYSNWQGSEGSQLHLTVKRTGRTQPEGYGNGNVLGSYVHGHWASNPLVAQNFVQACCRG